MAYIDGTQNIPAEIYKQVKATIGTQAQTGLVKKRMPFRLPNMQEGGKHVRQSQINQRERFKSVVSQFNNEDMSARSRWYEAEPEYSSFLWYYNYFILSGLSGNANGQQGGFGVI
jgi:primase-polymerase (primpol)-like protein